MQDIQACTCTWQCFQIKLIVKANVHIYPPLLIIGLQTMVTSLTVVHVRAQRENSSASGGSEGMDQMVQHYLNQCLASSTKKTYEAGKRRYSKFCVEANHSPPIPLSGKLLCQFTAHSARDGLKHPIIKMYLAAIRNWQIMAGLGDPFLKDTPLLDYVLKGIKMEQAKASTGQPKERLPITPDIFLRVRTVLERDRSNYTSILLWAVYCTAFFGFLRAGEIMVPSLDPRYHLCVGDVYFNSSSSPSLVSVRIKASKTDLFRKGVMIHLGRTGGRLCLVSALAAYHVARGMKPGPCFVFKDGVPLSREKLVFHLRKNLEDSGIDSKNLLATASI